MFSKVSTCNHIQISRRLKVKSEQASCQRSPTRLFCAHHYEMDNSQIHACYTYLVPLEA